MSNPSNNFSSDLDPYDRLAQMYGVGLFDLLPLPPSWSNYVRAQYAPDPALFLAPAPAIPGFRKLPDLMEAQALIGSGSPGFDPLPAAPLPIEPSPLFPSELPGLDKAIARINAPTPGFHLTPGLGGFTRNASGPALSLPPLPPPLLTPSGGGFSALGSGLPPTMSAPQQQPTSFNAPGSPPNTGFADASGLVPAGYPSTSPLPPEAGPQAAPTSTPLLVLAQANSMPMSGPGPMSRPIGAPSEAPADPNDIYARMNRQQPQMSVPAVPHPEPQAVQNVEPPTPGDKAWQATKDAASAVNNGVNWTANYIQTVLAGALADTIGLPHTAGTAVDLLSEVTGLPFNDTVLMRPLMTIARALPSSEQASRELFEMVRTFDPDFQVKSIHPVVDAGLRGLLGGAINKALGAAIGLSGAANPTIDLGTAARKFGQSAGLEALKEVWPLLDQQTRNAVQRQIFFTANPPMQVPIGQPRGPVPGPGGGLGGPNWYIPPPSGR